MRFIKLERETPIQKLNLHARTELALISGMLLGSCSGVDQINRDEIIDIAGDAVDASGIGGQLERLESRIVEIETLEARIVSLEKQVESNNESIDMLIESAQSDLDREGRHAERLSAIEDRLRI